ncbi:hypothetical protein HELRODRAFT_179731 [Helobdella robusta]|uniref:Uncharacterized protein n=1 Tax=Helobdella robusta TaxID=6412 RepID=T1FF31_HELRO|nr:hypothetical protein HELRODRAFT_179731 [Helobdella robusta]ESN95135.1 hypothetical protein HELRODRAFT_179731 [Helobdella robusta]
MPWLKSIQVVFFIFGLVMGIYMIVLLAFGFLATGLTRENLFSNFKSAIGGRIFAAILMGTTYVLNTIWLGITFLSAVPIIIYIMVKSICVNEIEQRDYCNNNNNNNNNNFPNRDFWYKYNVVFLVYQVYDAGPMYCFAYIGSFFIVVGLKIFLISLSSNYHRIKTSRTMREYRSYIDLTEPNAS